MNCAHVNQVLDAYIDNELDAQTSTRITQHLAECPACTAAQAERDGLRTTLRAHAPFYNAPDTLRKQIESFAGSGAKQPSMAIPRGRQVSWFTAGAFACLAALAGLLAGLWLARPVSVTGDPLREQVAASHVASLTVNGRLTDVTVSDQHVIKPWFQGKVDFAPDVRDFSTEGFRLVGARLDHVGERQAAAIVYRIRNHVINVFVWRSAHHETEAPGVTAARGYGVATWSSGGLRYAAISDVDQRDLQRLAALMTRSP